ncbi:MAG TPA: phosphotransferase family protein [Acidimicrobiales bacterium]|nr:phosphotransferase family protein [Acidimicrobiales bacterium]
MALDRSHAAALASWLGPRLGARGTPAIDEVVALATGYSAETVAFRVRYEDGAGGHQARLVLRRESPEPAVYPQQAPGHDVEVDIQYRVMSALGAGTSVPLAPLLGYEASTELLGAPFFVMGFVSGSVPLVTPSYAQEGFFSDASPGERRRMIDDGIRVLAELHTLDWDGQGLGWLVPESAEPTAERQVDIWRRYAEAELDGRSHPLMEGAFAWLAANAPAHDPGAVTFNWGDPRPGNMIWDEFRCVCVTDFEAAAVAPCCVDLGWWLMFDRWSHEAAGVERLDGEPSREEQAFAYFRASGRPPVALHWFEVFAAVRYCAIVVRVMNRTVQRGLMPADNTIWLENQATVCLGQLMEEGS